MLTKKLTLSLLAASLTGLLVAFWRSLEEFGGVLAGDETATQQQPYPHQVGPFGEPAYVPRRGRV